RDAATDEVNAGGPQRSFATAGVLEPGVAAVNQHVAAVEQRLQLVDRHVDGFTGRNHHHDPPRPRQGTGEGLERRRAFELRTRMLADEIRDPFGFQVPDRDTIAARLDIERQVAPHGPKPDDAEVRSAHDTFLDATTARSNARSRALMRSSSP